MENDFCFLCKPKYAEEDNRFYKALREDEICKFFLYFYLLQSSWNFVLARADISFKLKAFSIYTMLLLY